ncbi:hypothetical protein ADZ37_24025 [Pannonibacter phragmitetus]|uniref:ceramide glucosyltransferase n=1 Tax=Pannonibacter phragmitetus TaxID=121719 RepID=UPI00067AA133|nr:ceramide glucosyltransferase [Pannonibacter phragmitetus]KND16248.1 hypothetical protein ADZ37_24025 [Pannonibacter phragmitetus]
MMAALFLLFSSLLAGFHLLSIALCWVRLSRDIDRAGTIGSPAVTLLRPVCGIDNFARETLSSSFLQDYPDFEVIFCVRDTEDESLPLLHSLLMEFPNANARVLVGGAHVTGNPKLDNLLKGWDAARNDWICMTDSNLLLPSDYLRRVVGSWDENTGLVSSPAIGIQPDGVAASLECAFLNSNQARLQLVADTLGSGFAQGKTLFWQRQMLGQNGGISILGRNLAEDVAATKLVRSLGRKVTLPIKPFAQPVGRRQLKDVWHRQLRWSRVRRDGFPLLFLCEILNGPVLPFLALFGALGLLHLSLWWGLPYVVLWYAPEILFASCVGWISSRRDLLGLVLRDLLLPALWIASFTNRELRWRGTLLSQQDQNLLSDLPENKPQ